MSRIWKKDWRGYLRMGHRSGETESGQRALCFILPPVSRFFKVEIPWELAGFRMFTRMRRESPIGIRDVTNRDLFDTSHSASSNDASFSRLILGRSNADFSLTRPFPLFDIHDAMHSWFSRMRQIICIASSGHDRFDG